MSSLRAAANAVTFLFNVFPMLPTWPVNWRTRPPRVERLRYPTAAGTVAADLYRPAGEDPVPGVVVCLGVVPFGVEHPQVPRLGRALARAGFAALLHWSPAMRDERLDPRDSEDIACAYERLLALPGIDPARSGLLGTCVGGAFALMAAAQPRIRDQVGYVFAYAPYASMWTLARDVASASRVRNAGREPWEVDPLTRNVFVRSLTAVLEPGEAERLRASEQGQDHLVDARDLSELGHAVLTLLGRLSPDEATTALRRLPAELQARLEAMSPLHYARDLHTPLVILCHDVDDPVVPVSETRTLAAALATHTEVRYTEFTVFKHLDPMRQKTGWLKLCRELGRFGVATYPVFQRAVAAEQRDVRTQLAGR
jgi:hypothetical protein